MNCEEWIAERNKYVEQYQKRGFSIIPIKEDKTPYIKWMEYQKRKPEIEEIYGMCFECPDMNIGVVTGIVSNLVVFDYDYKVSFAQVPSFFKNTTISETKRGFHFWFMSLQNICSQRLSDGTELKGNGAYILAPPSIVKIQGVPYKYSFLNGLDSLQILPDDYMKRSLNERRINKPTEVVKYKFEDGNFKCIKKILNRKLVEGERDQNLFILNNLLIKKNTPEYSEKIVRKKNSSLECPLSEQELKNIFHKEYAQLGCAYIRANLPYIDCTGCKYLKREVKGLRDWMYISKNVEFSADFRVFSALIRKGYAEDSNIINTISRTRLASELGLSRKTVIEAIKKIKRNLLLINPINSNFPS